MKIINWFKDLDFQSGLKIEALHEGKGTKEIRIIMPKGELMKEHKAPEEIMVQVLKGRIWFEVLGDRYEFDRGDMISLEAKVPHSLGAFEDSVIRLSLNKKDEVKRVWEVAR